MKRIQHKHLLIRAEIKNLPEPFLYSVFDINGEINKIDETKKQLNINVRTLIEAIGMKVVLEPRCIWVSERGNEGYTGQAGLETSHIAYHIWNNPESKIMKNKGAGLIQMDVYTCGCLNKKQLKIIRKWVDDMFGIVEYDAILIDRSKTLVANYGRVGDLGD